VDRAFELGMRRIGLGRHRDIGAVAGRALGDGEADAARGAGDEERPTFERHHILLTAHACKRDLQASQTVLSVAT
jgi:hypothetical protein